MSKITNEMLQAQMLRHGELLLLPLDELPENIEQIFKGKRYIIGHSETGHHHIAVGALPGAITVFKPIGADSPDLFLKVSSPSKVEHRKTHDRHINIDIPAGVYLVRPKTEYDPFRKLVEQVRD